MLEGKNVNLRIVEKEDLPLLSEWLSTPEFMGDFLPPLQRSGAEIEKAFSEASPFELKRFIVEKKDGSKIGYIMHFSLSHPAGKLLEVGYALAPNERCKGYCTEALKIMVDYLFLSTEIMRIQACTDEKNFASQKALEKAGFKREGIMRNAFFCRGKWTRDHLYSIIREEWKEPKILTIKT